MSEPIAKWVFKVERDKWRLSSGRSLSKVDLLRSRYKSVGLSGLRYDTRS